MTFYILSHKNEHVEIPTRVYFVSLPIALSHPCLREHTLIAHKCVFNPKMWIVTHAQSGQRVGFGDTRKEAIDDAQRKIESYANDQISAIFDAVIETHGFAPGQKKEKTA